MGLDMLGKNLTFIFIVVSCCIVCISAIAWAECPLADLSGDCIVDMDDLVILSEVWLSTELPIHADLVCRWKLDETEGETAADEVGSNTGQLYGDPQWMPSEGYWQGSLFLDGIDDYIEATGYKGISGATSRTCSAWIKTITNQEEVFLSWGDNQAGQKWMFRVNSDGTLGLGIWDGYSHTAKKVNDGEWHHVAAVITNDGTPIISEVQFYIDSILQTDSIASNSQVVNTASSQDVIIGARQDDNILYALFSGFIDDVHLYNKALTAEDIFNLFSVGTALHQDPDLTVDSKVNIEDYAVVSRQWNSKGPSVIISEFMASNDAENPPLTEEGQILDGNGESSDWIELYNQTDYPVNLSDWGLSDDEMELLQWQFPNDLVIQPGEYLLVFASGKDQDDYPDNYPYVDQAGYLHTNFKLSASGEFLALTRPDGEIEHVYNTVLNPSSGILGFPEQEENISYGEFYGNNYYFALPTPSSGNQQYFLGFVDPPDFSHERGFYENSFNLTLTTETNGAVIRYTQDGTDPSLSNGITYSGPITITVPSSSSAGKCIRAAAFKPGYVTDKIKSKTYILNPTDAMKGLPAVCLSGSPTETFYNPNGVMAIIGGTWGSSGWYAIDPGDYNNMLGHGMDYERPVSMEYFNPVLGLDYQEDCGLRVHGSVWMRPRYTYPSTTGIWSGNGKIALRLYFRGQYGDTFFRHPVLEQYLDVDKFDAIVLRSGHNDRTNPFIRDEMIRRLQYAMGHSASLGTFVNMYINGSYKGYFNLCERINEEFCQKYFDSSSQWDIVGWIQPGNTLEARDGDVIAFNNFISYARDNDLSDPVHYNQVISQLDLEGFVDYIILQTWGGNWDWPQNNWSAAAERLPDHKWRFFVWDAEGAMHNDVNRDRLSALNSDSSYLSRLYQALKVNEDFRMLFADRLQKHFLDSDSVMRKDYLDSLFWQLASEVQGVIPGIDTYIPVTYIPSREDIFFGQCINQGLFTFEGPRFYLNGSEFEKSDSGLENSILEIQNAPSQTGDIYFTLDGTDPRISLSEQTQDVVLVSEDAAKRVWVPTYDIGTSWREQVTFDDSSWNAGLPVDNSKTGGVGYERNAPGNSDYISYDVHDEMYSNRTSAYIRIPFTVDPAEMSGWNYMTLSIRYDDGFVAYINGTEVCRRSFNGTPLWNSTASSQHENYGFENIPINSYLSVLQPGNNILAIQGLNIGTTSSDFIISPILSAGYIDDSGAGISPTAQLYTSPVPLQKSVHIKARTLNGTTWSALRQVDVVIGHINENLRISELMYHPSDPNEEYIELTNIGISDINLNNVYFDDGIDYHFGDTVLSPGEFVLLVQDQTVFESRYGTGLPVIGQYEGRLDDGGEKIKLCDIAGDKIQTLDYDDDWYDITDGDGFSLTATDLANEKTVLPQTDLVASWALDEENGTVVLDDVGAHHGTVMNMQNTDRVLGRQYKALGFDGLDDYVTMTGYKGITGTASRTCGAWIKTITNQDAVFLSWGNDHAGQKWMFRVNSDGALGLGIWEGYAQTIQTVNDGKWHHVAVVINDDGNPDISEAQFFIDGDFQEDVFVSNTQLINTVSTQDVVLGARYSGIAVDLFPGVIDDVRIYSRALNADEIAFLAQDIPWGQKELWRPSAIRGGTPGRVETPQEKLPDPGSIVINEILSHSHAALLDWIELYNTTGEDIAIGGWFISDTYSLTEADRKKYQIPAGVVLTPANPYYVIEESGFNNASNPNCRIPFALSEGGETLYLQSGQGEVLTGYFEKEQFGAAQSNVSLGRFQKSTGTWNFVPMSSQTKGAANAYPQVGPVIMTEVMYNPGPLESDQDHEYIELMNITDQMIRTASWVSTYSSPTEHIEEWIPWQFTDGIVFEFPVDMEFAPGQRILLVKNLQAFNAEYPSVPGGTVVLEWTAGSLDNGGEKLQLSMPGDKEYLQDRYYIREDRVNYDDEDDWPSLADGTGNSLTHIQPDTDYNNYTNDPINWTDAIPTPGW